MLQLARGLGMKVMLGCMTETSCGISAASHLSPMVDWADLDGALLMQPRPVQAGYAGDVSAPLAWEWMQLGEAVLVDSHGRVHSRQVRPGRPRGCIFQDVQTNTR